MAKKPQIISRWLSMPFYVTTFCFCAGLPVPGEAREQLGIVGGSGWRSVHDDDVESGQCRLVMPKRLANDAFQSIAGGSSATVLLTDREAEPGAIDPVMPA